MRYDHLGDVSWARAPDRGVDPSSELSAPRDTSATDWRCILSGAAESMKGSPLIEMTQGPRLQNRSATDTAIVEYGQFRSTVLSRRSGPGSGFCIVKPCEHAFVAERLFAEPPHRGTRILGRAQALAWSQVLAVVTR